MHRNTKVATCCYCGTRAALVLNEAHTALVCSACGAPLSAFKNLPSDVPAKQAKTDHKLTATAPYGPDMRRPEKRKKPKRKKPKVKKILGGLWDEIEDIFD